MLFGFGNSLGSGKATPEITVSNSVFAWWSLKHKNFWCDMHVNFFFAKIEKFVYKPILVRHGSNQDCCYVFFHHYMSLSPWIFYWTIVIFFVDFLWFLEKKYSSDFFHLAVTHLRHKKIWCDSEKMQVLKETPSFWLCVCIFL